MSRYPRLSEQYVMEIRERKQYDDKAGVRQAGQRTEDRVDDQHSSEHFDVASRDQFACDVSNARCEQEQIRR